MCSKTKEEEEQKKGDYCKLIRSDISSMPSTFWIKQTGTRRFMTAYTAVMAATTIGEAKFGYDAIFDISDYSDRPDRLSRLALHIMLQFIHVFMCIYWIRCARMEYIPGMECAFSGMLIRSCGNYIHSLGTVTYESFILPRTVVNVIKISSWIPTDLRLWYATFWLVIEVCVLVRLYVYAQDLADLHLLAAAAHPSSEVTSQPQEDSPERPASVVPTVATVSR